MKCCSKQMTFLFVADGIFQRYLKITLNPHYVLQCDLDTHQEIVISLFS